MLKGDIDPTDHEWQRNKPGRKGLSWIFVSAGYSGRIKRDRARRWTMRF